MATFLAAEVVNNQISFKETESKKTQLPFPQGAIKFKRFNIRSKARTVEMAMPLDPHITEIPLVGEYVLIIQLLDKNADPYFQKHQYYYGIESMKINYLVYNHHHLRLYLLMKGACKRKSLK